MSFLSNIFAKLKRENPARQVSSLPLAFVPRELQLTPEEMLSLSTVWAAVRALVDPIASSEFKVFERDAKGVRKSVDDLVGYCLNVRPCPDLTAQAFKEILLTQAILTGNGYAEIVKDNAGRVAELWPLVSDRMRVQRGEDGALVYVYVQESGEQAYLTPSQVLHIRGPSLKGFTGDSVIFRAAKAIALAVAQERFASAYYQNGAVLGGTLKSPVPLNDGTRDRLKADWRAKHGGAARAHSIAILEGGMSFEPFEVDADKTQLVPSRAFSVEEVARFFGVPLVLLQVQASAQGYGSNLATLMTQFARSTLVPWCNRLTEEIVFKCYPARAPWRAVEVDLVWLTLGDALQRAQAYEVLIRTGVKSVNECRAIEGDNSIGPEGDLHLVQSGLTLLDEENLTKSAPAVGPGTAPPPPANAGSVEAEGPGPDGEEAEDQVVELLNAHLRRVQARKADLARNNLGPTETALNLTKLDEKAKGRLAELYPAASSAVLKAAVDAVNAGVEPEKAAAHLLRSI